MLLAPGDLPWDTGQAFTIRDANRDNYDVVDHWLAMNLASNMTEFKQSFQDYDGVIFNNTMAADKTGNTFLH
jgi:acyl-homoserine-lactone acylase